MAQKSKDKVMPGEKFQAPPHADYSDEITQKDYDRLDSYLAEAQPDLGDVYVVSPPAW